MSNETTVRLGADASGYILELSRAGKSADAWAKSNEAAAQRTEAAQRAVAEATATGSEASTRSINRFMRTLTQQASTAGLTRTELLRLQAAQLGVSNSAAPFIAQMEAAEGAMKRASGQSMALTAGLDRVTGGAASAFSQVRELAAGMSPLAAAVVGIGVGVPVLVGIETAALRAARGLAQIQADVDKVTIGLKFINSGNIVAAGEDMAYLRAMAERLGLNLGQTSKDFVSLASAARGTSLEGDRTKDIFTAVAEASTVLHLSADETSGALLAIQQMMSKGSVQAEELRGQLGERLPGAFQIAARAMGVSTAELSKMLEQGQVLSEDFLPKFAAQLRREFAGAVEEASNSAQAALGRSETAWTDFVRAIVDSGLGEAAARELNQVASGLNTITGLIRKLKGEGGDSGVMGAIGTGLNTALNAYNPVRGVLQSERLWGGLRSAAEPDKPALGVGDFASFEASVSAAEARDAKAMSDRIMSFINNGKSKTAEEQYNAAKAAVDAQFKAATKGVEEGSDVYVQAMQVATARKAELTEKYEKAGRTAGARADRLERSGDIEALQQQYKDEEDALRNHLSEIRAQQQQGLITARDALDQELAARQAALGKQAALIQKEIDLSQGADQVKARTRYEGELRRVNASIEKAQQDHVNAVAQLNRKDALELKAYTDALANALSVREQAIRAQVAGVGLGSAERDQLGRINQVNQDVDRKRYDLANALDRKDITQEKYDERLKALQQYQEQRVQMEVDATQRVREANGEWTNGLTAAYQELAERARDFAGQTKSALGGLYDGLLDAVGAWATGTSVKIADVGKAFAAAIIKMQIQAAASPLVGVATQFISSLFQPANWTTTNTGNPWSLSSLGVAGMGSAGGRAGGGSTGAGLMYEVNEEGPELYTTEGRTYLMAGGRGGYVTPLDTGRAPAAASAGSAPSLELNLINKGTPQQMSQGPTRFDGKRWVQDVILSDLRQNGPVAQGISNMRRT